METEGNVNRSHDRLIPTIVELIDLNRYAKSCYEAGLSTYSGSTAWKFPFALSWNAEPSTPDRDAARQWRTEDLGKYWDRLKRYFVDWLDQPGKIDQLALASTLSLCGEATSSDQILLCLDADFQSLKIEEQKGHKRAVAKRQKSLRTQRGILVTRSLAERVWKKKGARTWEEFANDINVNPKTLLKARTLGCRIDKATYERIFGTSPPAESD